jgi:2-polyprenyl-3-methyl-5-hydroxy-6-metoxy-1,4-benzoquinol methylase
LLRDKGIQSYHGFDFSQKRVEQARKVCPEFEFTIEDAFKTKLFENFDYNIVICTEFLEHVERDQEIIEKIRPGAKFIGTVPNFPFVSHVRHFTSENEVNKRYSNYFNNFSCCSYYSNKQGRTFYLFEGEKRSG